MITSQQTEKLQKLVEAAQVITIVQAENPDADSLGTSTALTEILSAQGKEVHNQCSVEIPKYMRYIPGWEHVETTYEKSDLVIVVDASAKSLLQKSLEIIPNDIPWVTLDHHKTQTDIDFLELGINDSDYPAAALVLYDIASQLNWEINKTAATALIFAIQGDTLGLTSVATQPDTMRAVADLLESHDLNIGELEAKRRELSRKPLKVIEYKQKLMQRTELHFDNALVTVEIPLEEIKEISDLYNPAALFMEEMRVAEEVRLALAFKVYDDRITGKLREINDAPFCDKLAGAFGGGGHPYAAGFKVHDRTIEELKPEVLKKFYELLEEHHS